MVTVGLTLLLLSASGHPALQKVAGAPVSLFAVLDVKRKLAWKPDGTRINWPANVRTLSVIDAESPASPFERRYLLFRWSSKNRDDGMSLSGTCPEQPYNSHGLVGIGSGDGDKNLDVLLLYKPAANSPVTVDAIYGAGQWTEKLSFDIVRGKVSNPKTHGRWVKILRLLPGYSTTPEGTIKPAQRGYEAPSTRERMVIQYGITLPYPQDMESDELFDLKGRQVSGGLNNGLYGKLSQFTYVGSPESFSHFRVRERPIAKLSFQSIAMNPR